MRSASRATSRSSVRPAIHVAIGFANPAIINARNARRVQRPTRRAGNDCQHGDRQGHQRAHEPHAR